MKRILVISKEENDLIELLNGLNDIEIKLVSNCITVPETGIFDVLIITDWPEDIESSALLQKLISGDKPALARTRPGFKSPKESKPVSTRFMRLVCTGQPGPLADCRTHILDEQDNECLPAAPGENAVPIMVYKKNIMSHARLEDGAGDYQKADYAMWIENGDKLYCSFDFSNFARARFAPIGLWQKLISFILNTIIGTEVQAKYIPAYTNGFLTEKTISKTDSFSRAMTWFQKSGMIIDNGKGGVYEGFATEIKPTGKQKMAMEIRNDCCGEVMFSYFIDSILTGNPDSMKISHNLSDFIFSEMFTDDPGSLLHGMMKWSLKAYNICYQDDVARVLIPQMLKCRYSGTDRYLDKCSEALDFLYKTTGTDGLRVTRTENQRLDEAVIARLASEPAKYPSAHYTAFYSGALLLNYTLTGNTKFRDMGVRGLETIMSVYPDTKRCQSETQELCRLILPLSLQYEATGLEKHRDMLYRVVNDLQKFRHQSGAYLEWDTGYKSRYSRTTADECSILTKNGDPVSDLLYTINWLPFAFSQAYFITKDPQFFDLWQDISDFMAKSQIQSEDDTINGAWARGWDAETNEVFALPNDVGWGPWCIESGWTVAEIASGIGMGLLKDRLSGFHKTGAE